MFKNQSPENHIRFGKKHDSNKQKYDRCLNRTLDPNVKRLVLKILNMTPLIELRLRCDMNA